MRRAIDIHQHLWPDAFLSSLARRTAPPRLKRDGHGWWLELAGDAPARFNPADHDPAARVGFDRVVVAPSLPLGVEALPEAEALLEDFHSGVLALGAPFTLWASPARPALVDELLKAGAAGIALAGRELVDERWAPALERLAEAGKPLFVHPGPASGSPAWLPALTDYVAEMHAAWHAWAAYGRPRHPRLRVIFAMLAGLAPLHAERLAARGGPSDAVHDPLTFFDTSSYGPRAIDAMVRVVGVDRLLYGTDVPVVAPSDLAPLGEAALHALMVANPERVL
ncbi:amidohydrolase family protein [Solirubrobacter sp. CPCC 204708]|uniref:Amidohydrolase n=1 Tax=Solirubrobacter deserti TaxID=2282478 RepID=A0ABT4RHB9_9ACTN|nr:amidohydrolase family protein [Solirubrobacter deserti]MBE2315248.1 amidohydrolase family protein [Solirubrobacter deserti]MDA0137932.1 amidohydrolase [Solirubrobacter deserti]